MRILISAACVIAGLAASAAGQCASANVNCTTGWAGGNTNTFALILTAPAGGTTITGLELKTAGRNGGGAVQIELYLPDASGQPRIPAAATGTIQVGTAYGWYAGTFSKPIVVQGNQRYFASFNGAQMNHPICRGGGTTPTSYYWHPPSATTWRGTFTQNWVYKVKCDKGDYGVYGKGCPGSNKLVPQIGNSGVPTINQSFQVTLQNARPNTVALLFVGASDSLWLGLKLPADLTPYGAPGCALLASGEIQLPAVTSNGGAASQPIALPNNTWLIGQVFYNQWVIVDPNANALRTALSDGGAAAIGK